MRVRLRSTVHRGSVLAAGLVIDPRLTGEARARERILGLSAPGTQVFRASDRYLVIFSQPLRVDCAAAPGAPLVRIGRLLASCPLEPDERSRFVCGEGTVVLAMGDAPVVVDLSTAERLDLSAWVDLSSFATFEAVVSLGEVASDPAPLLLEIPADVRRALGAPDLSDEAKRVVDALKMAPLTGGARTASDGFWSWLRALGSWLRGLFRDGGGRAGHAAGGIAPLGSGGSVWSRVTQALERVARAVILQTRLARLLGRAHAAYFARLFEMLDSNQLDDALRHAIPLAGMGESPPGPVALVPPGPRLELVIRPERAMASTSMGLEPELYEALRQRYRRVFERLLARGELEKAAFVLAELLGVSEEAVAFLEKHGKLRLAAEVAEARHLSPGLVVRLWFLAGDRARAIEIARQTGAFAEAVHRLERSHAKEAAELRLLWGDALASDGAYAAAVEVVWPVEGARRLAATWLELAIAVGGPTALRMLVKKVRLLPGAFPEVRHRIAEALKEEGVDLWSVLRPLAAELLEGEVTVEARMLAKVVARKLLPVAGVDEELVVKRLLAYAGDAVFRADARAAASERGSEPGSSFRVRALGLSHVGKAFELQGDECLAAELSSRLAQQDGKALDRSADLDGVVLGVFDEGGGSRAGPIVARVAAETIHRELRGAFNQWGRDPWRWARCLARSVEIAGQEIRARVKSKKLHPGMATTATVATICGARLLLAQVGDSRGYVFRANRLVQVTRDHTLLNEYVEQREAEGMPVTQAELESFPHPNVITRALGQAPDVPVDVGEVQLQDGDRILLCSDGLWRVVDDERLRSAFLAHSTPRGVAHALLSIALEAGAPDNIAVLVANVEGGGSLEADRPPVIARPIVPPGTPLRSLGVPLEVRRRGADTGSISVWDAVVLPDGKLLLALGEVGAWLFSREGRVLNRFLEPAYAIVISDQGDRAILLAARGEAFRVTLLDLVKRQLMPWCDAHFEHFAPDFDGASWLVARKDSVYAIKVAPARWEHSFKVDLPGSLVAEIRRHSTKVSVWFRSSVSADELWTFEAPSLTLRHRSALTHEGHRAWQGAISATGGFAAWRAGGGDGPAGKVLLPQGGDRWIDLPPLGVGCAEPPCLSDDWLAIPIAHQGVTTVHVLDLPGLSVRARVVMDGVEGQGTRVRVRIQGEHLIVSDSAGRVIVLSLASGAVLRELRVS